MTRAAHEAPFGTAAPGERTATAPALPCPACGAEDVRPRFEKHGWRFVRCGGCRLVRLDPLPDPATLAQVYERSYRDGLYSTFARSTDVRAATAAARVAALRPHVPPGPWLDVGAATGALLRAAGAAGIDAEGIELAAPAVAAARASGLRVTQASADDFVPARRYACVTAFDLVEHLTDPAAFLARVRGWVVPEGRLALTVPDIGSVQARLMGRRWYYYAPPVHVFYFDRRTIRALLARHGWRPLVVRAAPKIMTVDYALTMLAAFNPTVHRVARAAAAVVPRGLRARPIPLPVGEILVIAAAA
jgi:SAM-dependent methyltransferase